MHIVQSIKHVSCSFLITQANWQIIQHIKRQRELIKYYTKSQRNSRDTKLVSSIFWLCFWPWRTHIFIITHPLHKLIIHIINNIFKYYSHIKIPNNWIWQPKRKPFNTYLNWISLLMKLNQNIININMITCVYILNESILNI